MPWALGLLAGSWLLPLLTHLIEFDLILLPVILVAVGSVIRAGDTVVDRLMFAFTLMLGGSIVFGLVFSVWPWGLNPLPMTGFTLSTLVVVGFVLGRRPSLPRRFLGSDVLVLAAPLLAYWMMSQPLRGRSYVEQLPFLTSRDDALNHFTLFDAMRHVGGFGFLHGESSAQFVLAGNQYSYPCGAHFFYALLDAFRMSSNDPGPAKAEFMRYAQYEVVGFALLCLAITWAARWIAGPAMAGWRRGLICGVTGSLAVFGSLSTLVWQGFDGELFALIPLALLTAVLCRPPHRVREQILAVASLVISVSFAYGLFMAFAASGVVIALVFHRKRLLRYWRFALATATIALPIALIPFIETKLHPGDAGLPPLFERGGTFWPFSRADSLAFALIAMAGLLTRAGRRSPVWWTLSLIALAANVIAVYTEWIGISHLGQPKYYSAKMVEAAWVVSLVGFGTVGMFLKPMAKSAKTFLGTRRSADLAAGTAAVLVAATLARGLPLADGNWDWQGQAPRDISITAVYARGYIWSGIAEPAMAYAKALPVGDGVPTVAIFSDNSGDNQRMTMWLAAENHDLGIMSVYGLWGLDKLATAKPVPAGKPLPAEVQKSISGLESWLKNRPVGTRVAVVNDMVAQRLRQFAKENPQLGLSVVKFPGGW